MLTKAQTKASIDTLMTLLMTKSYKEISMREVADAAKVPVPKFLLAYNSKLDLIEAFARRIDEEILAEDDADMLDEPMRERLFDVMMRRYDTLAPFKLALIQLDRDSRNDPILLSGLAGISSRSMVRMAASVGLDLSGPKGAVTLAGLLDVHRQVLQIWLSESDAGQARTLAALDKALRRAERRAGDLDRAFGMMGGGITRPRGPMCMLRDLADRLSPGRREADAT